MTLPSAEILVKWSLHDILSWLEREGLSEFKDHFRKDGIDGSRFCKLQESDVDRYYCSNKKKKQLLKNHIANIDRSKINSKPRYSEMWKNQQNQQKVSSIRQVEQAPALPPPRVPRTVAEEDNDVDNEDVYDWGDDFSSDSDSDSDALSDNVDNEVVEQDNYETPCPRSTNTQQEDNMVANLLCALEKHRASKRIKNPAPAPVASDDEEDYVVPVVQGRPPPNPPAELPPRPARRGVPCVPGSDAPQSHAPPIPSPHQPSHRRTDRLPSPPKDQPIPSEEEKPGNRRQLPPVPTARVTKQNTSDIQLPPPPRKKSIPKPVPPPPKKVSSPHPDPPDLQDDYETMEQPVKTKTGKRIKKPEEPADALLAFPWYHSSVDRSKAEQLLKVKNEDGMYLIRKSTRAGTDQKYTLMIYNQEKVYNLPVRSPQANKYVLGKHRQDEIVFDSVPDLIAYFSNMTIQLNPADRSKTGRTKLLTPLRKT